MPYMNLDDHDTFLHLPQLFFAAHPAYREENERVRAATDQPGQYFYSVAMTRALASWAREKHLIRRKEAARLIEVAERLSVRPAEAVPVTPRLLGGRRQLTVLASDVFGWLFACAPPQEQGTDYALSLAMACTILRQTADDATKPEEERGRAHQLIAWLDAQHADGG